MAVRVELEPKTFLTSIFKAAVAAADPELTIAKHLPQRPKGRTIVIGAGKGSAQMAAALEKAWDGPLEGVVVTRYGYGATCQRIRRDRGSASGARRGRARRLAHAARTGCRAQRRRSGDRVDLRRRLGAAAIATGWADARRRDRGQPGAARVRGADRGDEHTAQARLHDQGRAAGGSRVSGESRVAGGLGHSRRQPGAGRLRPDHSGWIEPRRGAGDRRGLPHATARRRHGASQLAGSRRTARRRHRALHATKSVSSLPRRSRWKPPRQKRSGTASRR